MTVKEFFKKFKEKFLKFWRSENNVISIFRDILIAFLLVLIILCALWAYTDQWFGTPMVAIESGSMTHHNEPFGRFGTIDAGDMVLLVKINSKNDIVTYSAKDPNNYYYGDYGDVVVYHPLGDQRTDQIIHRAICWVEYNEESKTSTVVAYNLTDVKEINIPQLGLKNYKPTNSGFITKGDNNYACDQAGGICDEPVKVEWISGKARGELPWVGTLNLIFNDITQGEHNLGNVAQDSIVCLILLIVILISIPVSLDIYSYYKEKKKQQP